MCIIETSDICFLLEDVDYLMTTSVLCDLCFGETIFSLALGELLRIKGFIEVKMQARDKWSDFYGSNKYGMATRR
jgi:transposase